MKCDSSRQGNVVTIKPYGLLVGSDVDDLKMHLSELVAEGSIEVVVDASSIVFVDSRGLEMLLDMAERMIQNGRMLKFAGISPSLEEVLELTELAPLFRFYSTSPEAVESCR
jgi:anti-anti-sigma factor